MVGSRAILPMTAEVKDGGVVAETFLGLDSFDWTILGTIVGVVGLVGYATKYRSAGREDARLVEVGRSLPFAGMLPVLQVRNGGPEAICDVEAKVEDDAGHVKDVKIPLVGASRAEMLGHMQDRLISVRWKDHEGRTWQLADCKLRRIHIWQLDAEP
jgi:hypothetical protein